LLLGLDLGRPARSAAEQALAHGYLLNVVQGNVLRFLPPFLLERQHVDAVMDLLHRLLVPEGHLSPATETMAAASAL
jgi:acetylornithine/succinyldiaminopimelate/putrescine aminotransferase